MISKIYLFRFVLLILPVLLLNCASNGFRNEKSNDLQTMYVGSYQDESNNIKLLASIQNQIYDLYPYLLKSTVNVGCSNNPGTGVLISEKGYVLTAKHLLETYEIGEKIEVCLSDGSSYMADILGQDFSLDYGLLKINSDKKFSYSKIGRSDDLSKDEALLMIGYSNSPPTLRLGFYKGINLCGFLKTTCIMQPGDSGGPVFDLKGNVIGVSSHISNNFDENYYVPIDDIKKNLRRLKKGEIISRELWQNNCLSIEVSKEPEYKEKPFVIKGGKKTIKSMLSIYNNKYQKSVVTIKSVKEEFGYKTYGSIVNNKGIVVAKSSEVKDSITTCSLYDNTTVKCQIISRNKENDIVLLKIDTPQKLTAIPLDFTKQVNPGDILTTITQTENTSYYSAGIVSSECVNLRLGGIGSLGIYFEKGKRLVVDSLNEEGAAKRGGLKKGDQVIKFNNQDVSSVVKLSLLAQKTVPYELVTVSILRQGKELSKNFEIGKLPSYGYNKVHIADYTKVNFRNTDFPLVFMHDIAIKPEDCGTPVINYKGEVVGINIGRKDRASSLAIPISHVKSIISKI